jgi:hypothetical protein
VAKGSSPRRVLTLKERQDAGKAARRTDEPARPPGVAPPTWTVLAANVAAALRHKTPRGASGVRRAVLNIVDELRRAGESWDTIEATVTSAVHGHPLFGDLDRMNVVTGRRSSDTLVGWMVGWVHQARQMEESGLAIHHPSPHRRIDVAKAETVLAELSPLLDQVSACIRDAEPELREDEVLARALGRAVITLRYRLNVQTFEYLRWRVERLRHAIRGESVLRSDRE